MSDVTRIGTPPWRRDEILAALDEFSALYAGRPLRDNQGGMLAPQMFAVWFMVRALSPDRIVESGVWRGQSTWLLEQASPDAELVCIDLDLSRREYVSRRASYTDRDFCEHDWSGVTTRSLAFFDDHQSALVRLQQCKWFGFQHAIFEDNYPPRRGDCYSLKKAFAGARPEPLRAPPRRSRLARAPVKILSRLVSAAGRRSPALTHQHGAQRIPPDDAVARTLRRNLDVYYEFPPVLKNATTRWGDPWTDDAYPTPRPLLERVTSQLQSAFREEATNYTWACYARLR